MKKSIILAAAVVVLAACAKVSPSAPLVSNGNQEIDFQVANAVSSTKANFEGSVYADSNFGAWAWQKDANGYVKTNNVINYFMGSDAQGQEIKKQVVNSKTVWKAYGATYYWPKSGSLDFICFAPYNNGLSWFQVNSVEPGELNNITASVTNIAPDNADYLYSDKAVNCINNETNQVVDGTNSYNGVPVIFRHALAKVSVNVQAILVNDAMDNVAVITWIDGRLENVYKKGELSMSLSSEGATDNTKKWTAANGVWKYSSSVPTSADIDNFACAWPVADNIITKEAQSVLAERFVLPQALTDHSASDLANGFTDQQFYIKVNVKLYNGDQLQNVGTPDVCLIENAVPYSNSNYERTAKLSTMKSSPKTTDTIPYTPYWKMGTKTNYLITINPFTDEIYFDPAVSLWDTTTAAGTIVVAD